MSILLDSPESLPSAFVHGAFFYNDDDDYLAGTTAFIEEGLAADEPVLVAVPSQQLDLLRPHFEGRRPDRLRFAPMEEMGRNPGWIIPAWADFVAAHAAAGRRARGIGEPIWRGRGRDELVECGRHEALLNLAFREAVGFQLLCPYNAPSLDPWVLEEARRNHPHIGRPGATTTSERFDDDIPPLLTTPLPPVPRRRRDRRLRPRRVGPVRRHVARMAAAAGCTRRQGPGPGPGGQRGPHQQRPPWRRVRTDRLVAGRRPVPVRDPRPGADLRSAGRAATPQRRPGRRSGLWLMNQLCDLMQIRKRPDGQVIRLHILLS